MDPFLIVTALASGSTVAAGIYYIGLSVWARVNIQRKNPVRKPRPPRGGSGGSDAVESFAFGAEVEVAFADKRKAKRQSSEEWEREYHNALHAAAGWDSWENGRPIIVNDVTYGGSGHTYETYPDRHLPQCFCQPCKEAQRRFKRYAPVQHDSRKPSIRIGGGLV